MVIFGGIILGIGFVLMMMYNGLVGKKNQVENVFASMDAMLKKRYDLVPNLVAAVKTYMKHESGVLTEITELRSKALSGGISSDEQVDLDNKISKAIGGIMVAVENYPDLKASDNFLQLQRSLNEIEEQISAARRSFNAAVTDYNNAVEMFPTSIMAQMMNYKRKKVFEITEAERQNVNVGQLFDN
ncbi:MAG: LemA family protein [Candidatus Heimdallarchaeota archaeon]|nr:LemA family protein [Candidatus Heimdallarchaeota archaeon]